jgi:YVTN family beta-propeller protein
MGEAVGITAIPGIPSDLAAVVGQREAGIDSAVTAIAQAADDGDAAAARRGVDALDFHLSGIATAAARADATCASAEPARVEAADVNAWLEFPPIAGSAGFGSIWIAENRGDRVARLDTLTGEPIATVDVGPGPAIGQPADGYMWMRTDSDIVAIDPRTNAVAARLSKAGVGPEATRFRALDGALWICDGPRLHRYDPTTLTRLATIELGIHCGNVTATPDLVVVFPFRDETPPVAAFVDPATNQVVGQVPLPMPVFFATVQPDTVFFAGFDTAQAAVVDRASWAVTETPDLGRPTVGGTLATDGTSIYVPAASSREVLVIDAATFAVVDTIDPLEPWSVVFADGGLWVVPDNGAIAQRFER